MEEESKSELHQEFIHIEKKLNSSENFVVYDSILRSIDILEKAYKENSALLINTIFLRLSCLYTQTQSNASIRQKLKETFQSTYKYFHPVYNKE